MFPPTLQWRNLKANQIFSFYTTTGMFENGTATVKTHPLFSVHSTPKEFEDTQSSSAILHLYLGKLKQRNLIIFVI